MRPGIAPIQGLQRGVLPWGALLGSRLTATVDVFAARIPFGKRVAEATSRKVLVHLIAPDFRRSLRSVDGEARTLFFAGDPRALTLPITGEA